MLLYCLNTIARIRDPLIHTVKVDGEIDWFCLTVPVEDIPVFKNVVDKRLEALSETLFSLAGPTPWTVIVLMSIWPWGYSPRIGLGIWDLTYWPLSSPAIFPTALQYCVYEYVDIIWLISTMAFLPVHMQRKLGFIFCSVEYECKKCLLHMPVYGGSLFGSSLDNFINDITGRRAIIYLRLENILAPDWTVFYFLN